MALNVYEIITDRIIKSLEEGKAPWRQPWVGGGAPCNLISKKPYRGINVFLLGSSGFSSRYWLTYKQAAAKGGQVRKGEKSTPCIFWKFFEKEKANGEKDRGAILRYYSLFNLTQVDGIAPPAEEEAVVRDFLPIQACEEIMAQYSKGPPIVHGGGRACYNPALDLISLPEQTAFHSAEEYYSTLFHEQAHATGHKDRLNREGVTNVVKFGSHSYSYEELVAEMTAAFLSNEAGILTHTYDNSVAYLKNWVSKLKSEPKWVVQAGGAAAKAADFILQREQEKWSSEEDEGT